MAAGGDVSFRRQILFYTHYLPTPARINNEARTSTENASLRATTNLIRRRRSGVSVITAPMRYKNPGRDRSWWYRSLFLARFQTANTGATIFAFIFRPHRSTTT